MWLINLNLDRYIPMMISRMIISLKKVASSGQTHMGPDVPTVIPMSLQDTYTPHRVENIHLSTFKD